MPKQQGPLTQKNKRERRLYSLRLFILVSAIVFIGYFFYVQPFQQKLKEIPIEQTRP